MPLPRSHNKSPFPSKLSAPGFSQHYLGVCGVRHPQAHLHRQVRLDETGHYGPIWALCREDKVDAGGSALSSQPRDHILKVPPVVTSSQDQIREFVKHKDDEREVEFGLPLCDPKC